MQAVGWYTDDQVYNAVIAAFHILHAATNALPREPNADPATGVRQPQKREKGTERKLIA
jgi:hypothetical protein